MHSIYSNGKKVLKSLCLFIFVQEKYLREFCCILKNEHLNPTPDSRTTAQFQPNFEKKNPFVLTLTLVKKI